jgi:ABC-type nitrate/sulfonate/bicarbonate transport system ATPase subunit
MGTSAVFRIDDLSVSLGQPPVEILRGISIDVMHGETLALVGKSGSGKSTLVGALSGLLHPSGGAIHRSQGRHGDLRTATVFQTAHLFPWLSAVDNVALSLRLRNHPTRIRSKSLRRRRAQEIMEVLGIAEFALRFPHELSGGQQQRVAIARAVAAEPDVLLLDEPFSALDVATRASLQEWLVEHRHDLAPTVLLVTHDLSEALYVADRIALLSSDSGSLKIWTSDVRNRDQVTHSSVRAEIERQFFAATN